MLNSPLLAVVGEPPLVDTAGWLQRVTINKQHSVKKIMQLKIRISII